MLEALHAEATEHDFDFWLGRWHVRNRLLAERFTGSDDWVEFDATVEARRLAGGLGIQDVFRSDHAGGFVRMSVRLFDPEARRWAVYDADSRRPGLLDPPVLGGFAGALGVFEGYAVCGGRPVPVRSLWTRVTTEAPRWEQAFSDDGGATWETSWVMDFTQLGEGA